MIVVEVQTQVRVASGVKAIVVQAADRVEPLDSECNTSSFCSLDSANKSPQILNLSILPRRIVHCKTIKPLLHFGEFDCDATANPFQNDSQRDRREVAIPCRLHCDSVAK